MNYTGCLLRAALMVILVLPLMGMGGAGSPGQPDADSQFNATVRDTSGNEVKITSVSLDGRTTFNVLMGRGRVQIPFENISRIEMKQGSVCVNLKGAGTMCDLRTTGTGRIIGRMPYGLYQISMKDVAWIELTRVGQ